MLRYHLVWISLALGISPWGKVGLASPVVFPIDLLEDVPTTYVPGEPIEFQLRLPAISNLGAYQIDVLVESSAGTAGVDFTFDLPSASAATSGYVFSSSANFAAATNVEGPNRQRLTLTDFFLDGTDVVPGGNDLISTIVLQLSASLRASLNIKVDASSLILDTPQLAPTSVPEFQFIQNGIFASGAATLRAVPEPSAMWLLFSGLVAIFGRQFLRRQFL